MKNVVFTALQKKEKEITTYLHTCTWTRGLVLWCQKFQNGSIESSCIPGIPADSRTQWVPAGSTGFHRRRGEPFCRRDEYLGVASLQLASMNVNFM